MIGIHTAIISSKRAMTVTTSKQTQRRQENTKRKAAIAKTITTEHIRSEPILYEHTRSVLSKIEYNALRILKL